MRDGDDTRMTDMRSDDMRSDDVRSDDVQEERMRNGVKRISKVIAGVVARCRRAAEAGMTTAEYAVGTLAACGFAAVLYKVVTSGAVKSALSALIEKALNVSF